MSAPPKLPRDVKILSAVSFLQDISGDMAFPLLPLFLVGPLAAPIAVVGLMEGLADSTSAALRLAGGYASDKTGKRRPFVTAGYALAALARPVYAFATAWPTVVGGRFLDRVGKGIRTAPRDALIADSAPPEMYGRAFGLHRAMDSLGAVVGSLLALAIVLALAVPGDGAYRTVFLAALAPALGAVALTLAVRDVPGRPKATTALAASLRGLDARLKLFLAAAGIFAFARVSDGLLLVRASELGLGLTGVIGLYALQSAVYAASSFPAGALADRVGRKNVIVASFLLFGVLAAGFGLASTLPALAALFAGVGLFQGLSEGSQRAYVSELARPELRGTALGAHAMIIAGVALPSGLALGLVWQLYGSLLAFALASGAAIAATTLLSLAGRKGVA